MTDENYEKIHTEGLHVAVESLLMRNNFTYSNDFFGFRVPKLAQRQVELKIGWNPIWGNTKRLEILTLIPIYNIKKDNGKRVWDYRGTLIHNNIDDTFGTQFVRQFISVTQIFDFFEEGKW